MTQKNEVDQLWMAMVASGNIRYTAYPIGAAVAIVSDGAAAAWAYPAADLHIEIQAAGLLPADPCWFVGIVLLTNDLEVACYGDLAIGFGADAAGIDRAEFPYFNELAAVAAMNLQMLTYFLPHPVQIIGNPRVAGRIRKSSVASGTGITPKVLIATAIGA
ncbi:MAG: hypothetical protein E3J60_00555 [Dehalococcoidia bacterium]|nr:MAG: hypothetical protein E3J60_00555 [Dehalococcoidia bacterium]